MKKLKALLLLALLAVSFSLSAAPRKAKHVILIGLDGWGSYSVDKADMPCVKGLMQQGSYTLEKRAVFPSSSAPNWASMFMGAGPELHGYTDWNSKTPDLPPRVVDDHGMFPTVFGLLRKQDPKAVIGCIYEWGGIVNLVDTLSLDYRKQIKGDFVRPPVTTAAAVGYIKEAKPDLLAVIIDEPDHIGHAEGHDTPEYYAMMKTLDTCVAQIVQAVRDAGMWDDTVIIVTSDHGGLGKKHGGKTLEEMQTPFIIAGPGIKKGYAIQGSMMQFDVASTIAYILGLQQPQVWIGRPVTEIFK